MKEPPPIKKKYALAKEIEVLALDEGAAAVRPSHVAEVDKVRARRMPLRLRPHGRARHRDCLLS